MSHMIQDIDRDNLSTQSGVGITDQQSYQLKLDQLKSGH